MSPTVMRCALGWEPRARSMEVMDRFRLCQGMRVPARAASPQPRSRMWQVEFVRGRGSALGVSFLEGLLSSPAAPAARPPFRFWARKAFA